jgi:hypothetical protein
MSSKDRLCQRSAWETMWISKMTSKREQGLYWFNVQNDEERMEEVILMHWMPDYIQCSAIFLVRLPGKSRWQQLYFLAQAFLSPIPNWVLSSWILVTKWLINLYNFYKLGTQHWQYYRCICIHHRYVNKRVYCIAITGWTVNIAMICWEMLQYTFFDNQNQSSRSVYNINWR